MYGGKYSRDNLPVLKNKFYIVNLDDKHGEGTHWILIYNVKDKDCIYFDSFGIDPPEEVLKRMRDTKKRVLMNEFRIQDINSFMCGYFCNYVIKHLKNGRPYHEILLDFSSNDFKKNDEIMKKHI